jgi:hypothetical protein
MQEPRIACAGPGRMTRTERWPHRELGHRYKTLQPSRNVEAVPIYAENGKNTARPMKLTSQAKDIHLTPEAFATQNNTQKNKLSTDTQRSIL